MENNSTGKQKEIRLTMIDKRICRFSCLEDGIKVRHIDQAGFRIPILMLDWLVGNAKLPRSLVTIDGKPIKNDPFKDYGTNQQSDDKLRDSGNKNNEAGLKETSGSLGNQSTEPVKRNAEADKAK